MSRPFVSVSLVTFVSMIAVTLIAPCPNNPTSVYCRTSTAPLEPVNVIFYTAGGGDAVEMRIAWPGLPQPEGNASVTIRTATRAFRMRAGSPTNIHFTRGDEQKTYFQQDGHGSVTRLQRLYRCAAGVEGRRL